MTLTAHDVRAYGLAVAATTASVALTRFTWPLFGATPFVPMFFAVAITTHWGSGSAGLVAILLAMFGALLPLPAGGPPPSEPRTLAVFMLLALVANRILAGRNRTEAALRMSEAQLEATWEHAALGVALLDRQGHIDRINPALERLLGYSRAACTGMSFSAFSHPDEVTAERQRYAELVGGTDAFYQREQPCRRQDGTILWARVTVSAIRGPDAVPTGAVAVLEDVTAQRQAGLDLRASEERLRQGQKMEAVGQLAGGIAHDFNNMLTAILGYSELLTEQIGPDKRIGRDLKEIMVSAQRAATLTRQLLAFSRKQALTLVALDLSNVVRGVEAMLRRLIGARITIKTELADDLWPVIADAAQLEQVLMNLVVNARDAMPEGGVVTMSTGNVELDQRYTLTHPGATAGIHAMVSVSDTGVGIPRDIQAKIFEPFFTTKELGRGTGLGLAAVYGIVKQLNGYIEVESEIACGTTFRVYFPKTEEAVQAPPPLAPVTAAPVGTETILLVEDEAGVRSFIKTVLQRFGYTVIGVDSAEAALALLETLTAPIHLLLTDIVLPGMDGRDLAARVTRERPHLPVLYMSGYTGRTASVRETPETVGQVLEKPFTARALLTKTRELLETEATPVS